MKASLKRPHQEQWVGLLHGITGQRMIMLREEMFAYLESGMKLFEELQPVGVLEEQLAQKLVDLNWSMNRICAHRYRDMPKAGERDKKVETAVGERRKQPAPSAPEIEFDHRAWELEGRCVQRTASVFTELSRELDKLQSRRIAHGRDGFHREECAGLQWYRQKFLKLGGTERTAQAKHLTAN